MTNPGTYPTYPICMQPALMQPPSNMERTKSTQSCQHSSVGNTKLCISLGKKSRKEELL